MENKEIQLLLPGCSDGRDMPAEVPQPFVKTESSLSGRLFFHVACYSACGPRDKNQDAAACTLLKIQGDETVIAMSVADGMGCYSNGEEAASFVTHTFHREMTDAVLTEVLCNQDMDPIILLDDVIHKANQDLIAYSMQYAPDAQLGTTFVAALVHKSLLFLVGIGDSRAYAWRDRMLQQKTRDDSVVQGMVDAGELTQEQARMHRRANELTRALGWPYDLDGLKITQHVLKPNDIFVLCSDGVWKVGDDVIRNACDYLSEQAFTQTNLDQTVKALVEHALAEGSDDNATVAMLHVSGNIENLIQMQPINTNMEE